MSPLDFKTISELKQNAKQILEEVQKTRNQVAITINGKPVAVIVPVPREGFSMTEQERVEKNRAKTWNANKKENEKEEARLQKIEKRKDRLREKTMTKKK